MFSFTKKQALKRKKPVKFSPSLPDKKPDLPDISKDIEKIHNKLESIVEENERMDFEEPISEEMVQLSPERKFKLDELRHNLDEILEKQKQYSPIQKRYDELIKEITPRRHNSFDTNFVKPELKKKSSINQSATLPSMPEQPPKIRRSMSMIHHQTPRQTEALKKHQERMERIKKSRKGKR